MGTWGNVLISHPSPCNTFVNNPYHILMYVPHLCTKTHTHHTNTTHTHTHNTHTHTHTHTTHTHTQHTHTHTHTHTHRCQGSVVCVMCSHLLCPYFGLFPVLVSCHYELSMFQLCLSRYVLITLCILVLSFEFDVVWSTCDFPVYLVSLPCLVLPCGH